MTTSDETIRVTVLVITYNHEPYLRAAVDSVLMQETNFDFEIIISEDCSTDSTREIVMELQKEHPNRISLILSERNLCDNEVVARGLRAARGEYIALLDGDDFWTSPHKLQRQVDFLDQRPSHAICFHSIEVLWEVEPPEIDPVSPTNQPESSSIENLLDCNFAVNCSAMFRVEALDSIPPWFETVQAADRALFMLMARNGKVGYINEPMAVYRIHRQGFWSGMSRVRQLSELISTFRSLAEPFDEEFLEAARKTAAAFNAELAIERSNAAEAEQILTWHRQGSSRADSWQAANEFIGYRVATNKMVAAVIGGQDDLIHLYKHGWRAFPDLDRIGTQGLFAAGSEGSSEVSWLRKGIAYDFTLRRDQSPLAVVASARVVRAGASSISASPNPVRTDGGAGASTIKWCIGDGLPGSVYVSANGASEQLFAIGAEGEEIAPWIEQNVIYDFHLYGGDQFQADQNLLASVRVAGAGSAYVEVIPNPVPTGPGMGTANVSWSTGDDTVSLVYVTENGIWPNYYPFDSDAAIDQLNEALAGGVEFLLFPEKSFWWFEHYPEFAQYLNDRCAARWEDSCCVCYRLITSSQCTNRHRDA